MSAFFKMLWDYARFDFGTSSFFRGGTVIDLILQKMPVSITLGLWITLISYLISVPLGIAKALRDGSRFDTWTSAIIIVGYAIPGFLFGIMLIVFFAGGSFLGLGSRCAACGLIIGKQLSLWGKIKDYAWHITLPLTAMVMSAFATTTLCLPRIRSSMKSRSSMWSPPAPRALVRKSRCFTAMCSATRC